MKIGEFLTVTRDSNASRDDFFRIQIKKQIGERSVLEDLGDSMEFRITSNSLKELYNLMEGVSNESKPKKRLRNSTRKSKVLRKSR